MENSVPKEMRVVFVGRRNPFNNGLLQWLDDNYALIAVFHIEEDRFSLGARTRKIMKRAKHRGALRVFDELLFRGFHSLWHGASERRLWKRMIPKEFTRESAINNSTYSCDNIHEARWLSRIRDLAPHIILSVCTHTVFKPELFNIPKFGMFMLHEGLTPEYRGLHTPAWALLRKETELIGYTLLKIDEGIDTGRILCQGSYPDADNYGFCWSFIGHSALIHGLPQIKEALDGLYHQHGEFHEVSQANRNSSYYSWMALSDYLRFKIHENRRN